MLLLYELIAFLLIILTINFTAIKSNFLIDNKYDDHKKFSSNSKTPLTGGLFFLITILYYFDVSILLKICAISIYFLGLLSDINRISSPLIRIIIQIIIITIFVTTSNNFVENIRIELFDGLLNNIYFKTIFTIFCYLILINGSNFIDGMNSLLIGYFLLVLLSLLLLSTTNNLIIDIHTIKKLIICLLVLYILNVSGLLFVGDSGAYLISFIVGFILIKFTNDNPSISPYYATLLLWYPAFENLFSIIRKKIFKLNASDADNYHLHQLIFKFILKKTKLSKFFCNNITGIIINLFNLTIFILAIKYYFYTKYLILLIVLSTVIYNLLYIYLNKYLNSK